MRTGRLVLAALAALVASGCSRRYERQVTEWCRVRVREPLHGGGGMVQAGPDQREILEVRRGGGWKEVGRGSEGSVLPLARNRAVLWQPSITQSPLAVTPNGTARPIDDVFPCRGSNTWRTISPGGDAVDCGTCVSGDALNDTVYTNRVCRAVALERRTADGARAGSATVDVGGADCRFRRPGVQWYDAKDRAYSLAECRDGTRVLFRTDFGADPPERFASPGATEDPKGWIQAVGRLSLLYPKSFEALRGTHAQRVSR